MKKTGIIFVLLLIVLAFSPKIENIIPEIDINLTTLRDIFIGAFALFSVITVIIFIFFIKSIKRVAENKRQYRNVTIVSSIIIMIIFFAVREKSMNEETVEEKNQLEDTLTPDPFYGDSPVEQPKLFRTKWLGLASLILLLFVFIGKKKLKKQRVRKKRCLLSWNKKTRR